MSYTFPTNTKLPGGGYLVIAAAPADITSVYGITNVMGPYTGSLKKSRDAQLLDEQGAVLLTVPYSDVYPWPVATDGAGHSLVLANPTYGEGDPRAWDISDVVGGSPGQMDGFTPSPLRNVVINEILAHTGKSAGLRLHRALQSQHQRVDISGCILTDDPATNKFVIPPGTIIGAGGLCLITAKPTWISPSMARANASISSSPTAAAILDAVQFGRAGKRRCLLAAGRTGRTIFTR